MYGENSKAWNRVVLDLGTALSELARVMVDEVTLKSPIWAQGALEFEANASAKSQMGPPLSWT